MLPFTISLQSGVPVAEQVIFAVTKAIVAGQLRPGDPFPSVRALSQELKINPNTSHKIVAALIGEGLLIVHPGIGTVVGEGRPGSISARRQVVDDHAERFVVNARRAGLSLQEVIDAVRQQWKRLLNKAS
jgi:GntR family transcriptional regulator